MDDSLTFPDVQELAQFYPYQVDSCLYSVFEASLEGHSSRTMYGDRLDEERFDAISTLHEFLLPALELCGHASAQRVVTAALSEGKPICLYLRSFRLGGVVTESSLLLHGEPSFVNHRVMVDERIQGFLSVTSNDSMQLVGIADRTTGITSIPMFRVGDSDWRQLAGILIGLAGVVIMPLVSLTPGVAAEIDLLRGLRKQSVTLLIWHTDPLNEEWHQSGARALGAHPPPLQQNHDSDRAMLKDFPSQITLEDSDDLRPLTNPVVRLLSEVQQLQTEDVAIPAFPSELSPPEPIRLKAERYAKRLFATSLTQLVNGQRREAIDSAYLSIVFAHWARSRIGQALGIRQLAKVEEYGDCRPMILRDMYKMAFGVLRPLKADPLASKITADMMADYRSLVQAKAGRQLTEEELKIIFAMPEI